ncbi:MAG: GatB/YqeY domain-containing protein [Myxococcales bacterium]|nr:GatB/YqeY domain-containing protein [Myxococcales bacterium]
MSIQSELRDQLKDALRARDQRRANVVRQIETEISTRKSASGFSGAIDDELYRQVISAYVKKMDKARDEYAGLGERGAEEVETLTFEIEFLSRWLPKSLGEDEVRAIVREAIAELGVKDAKQAGRVVGHIMKSGREGLDGKLVNQLVRAELSA